MIKSFSCKNFKNINIDRLDFGKINILIGPNNVGKSNFIQALSFLSQMLKCKTSEENESSFWKYLQDCGWSKILNRNSENSQISFKWDIELDSQPLCYEFDFNIGKTLEDFRIENENLTSAEIVKNKEPYNYFICHKPINGKGKFSTATKKGEANNRISFSLKNNETIIRQFKDILIDNNQVYADKTVRNKVATLVKKLENYFLNFYICSCAQINISKIKESVSLINHDSFFKQNGENFTSIYNLYKSRDLEWHVNFTERMKQLMPNLRIADIVSEFEKIVFKLTLNNGTFDLSELSDGTVKALVLNMLINMPKSETKSLLAIDEPESNLHPAWQKVIGQWILNSSSFSQCFVSTHSPDFLDVFTEDFKENKVNVFVFTIDGRIKKIDFETIKEDLGDWELGDLYRTNDPSLGGWPW